MVARRGESKRVAVGRRRSSRRTLGGDCDAGDGTCFGISARGEVRGGKHLSARTPGAAALSRLGKEADDLFSFVTRCEATIRLHAVAGYNLIGVCNEAIELLLIPDEACLLHCAGKAVVR